MIILKSLAAGLLAVLATAMTITILAIVAVLALSARNNREDTSIGWDPVAFCAGASGLDHFPAGVRGRILLAV